MRSLPQTPTTIKATKKMMNRTRHITSVQLLHVAQKTTLLTHSSVYSQTDCKKINAHDLQKRCTRHIDDIAQATLVEFARRTISWLVGV